MIAGLRDLPLIVEILLAAGTLAGMVWAGIRYVWPFFRGTGRAISGLMAVGTRANDLIAGVEVQRRQTATLELIKHEVLPNGGGSMRDAVTQIQSRVSLLVGQQRARADADDDTATMDVDALGRVEWLSRALMIWTRRTSDELKVYGWISSIHPDEREDVAEEWNRCIRHRRQFDAAFRLVSREGEEILVRMAGVPVYIEGDTDTGQAVRWAVTLRRIVNAPDGLAPPERAPFHQSRSES